MGVGSAVTDQRRACVLLRARACECAGRRGSPSDRAYVGDFTNEQTKSPEQDLHVHWRIDRCMFSLVSFQNLGNHGMVLMVPFHSCHICMNGGAALSILR